MRRTSKEYFQCIRKKRYPTRDAALIAVERSGDPAIHTYSCPFCKTFHIGHHKRKGYLREWLRGRYDIS